MIDLIDSEMELALELAQKIFSEKGVEYLAILDMIKLVNDPKVNRISFDFYFDFISVKREKWDNSTSVRTALLKIMAAFDWASYEIHETSGTLIFYL